MTVKTCTTHGCPNDTQGGKCQGCKAKQRKHLDQKRGTAAQRGYGPAWRRFTRQFLQDNPLCQCGALSTEVDHNDGLGPRGPRGFDPTNCTARCKPCHSKRTARDQPGGFNT